MLSMLFSFGAVAQQNSLEQQQPQQEVVTDFEDSELQQFAKAAGKMIVIQQETEQKMIEVIEEEELDVNKFNEIMTAQQNQQTQDLEASEEDLQKFDKAATKIVQMQQEVQGEMVEAIQEEGLEPQKYEQILLAYQSDPEVKAKVDAYIQQ